MEFVAEQNAVQGANTRACAAPQCSLTRLWCGAGGCWLAYAACLAARIHDVNPWRLELCNNTISRPFFFILTSLVTCTLRLARAERNFLVDSKCASCRHLLISPSCQYTRNVQVRGLFTPQSRKRCICAVGRRVRWINFYPCGHDHRVANKNGLAAPQG